MKKTILFIFAALTVFIMMSSCCNCRTYQKKYGRPLVGTTWRMTQFEGRAVEGSNGDSYQILFSPDGRFSGRGDCNRLMGSYVYSSRGTINIDNVASTRMMCPNQQGEDEFIRVLDEATNYQLDGPYLYFFLDAELLAVFEAMPEKK